MAGSGCRFAWKAAPGGILWAMPEENGGPRSSGEHATGTRGTRRRTSPRGKAPPQPRWNARGDQAGRRPPPRWRYREAPPVREAGGSPRVDRIAAYPKCSARQEMSGCLVRRRILVTAQHGDLRPAKQSHAEDQQRNPDHKGYGMREKRHRRNEIQDHDQSYCDDRSKLDAWRRDRVARPVRRIGRHRRDHIAPSRAQRVLERGEGYGDGEHAQ